uniref:Serpentine receptor class gamma n=1 Tax=Globodera rostochiensis TaxID=31243 RepID=A0A914HUW0_GLORO
MDSSLFFSAMAVLANADLFPFLFALVIGIPSAMLYCLELSVIITNFAHFSSPFFVLVVVRTVLSLANYVFAFFAHRFGKIGLFLSVYLQLPRIVLAFLLFVGYYAFHVENLLTAFLLLNRCTAILCPMNYEKLWRRWLPLLLAVTFILPLPFTVPIFNLEMFVHVQNDNFTFTLDDHKTENELNSTEIAALSAVFFGIVCFLLNMATLFAYKLRPHSQKPNDQTEHKMTIYTVATFFGQLIMAIFMIFVYMTATNFVDEQNIRYSLLQKWFDINLEQDDILFLANFNQYPWVNDLSTVVIPAWLLLWASTKMQQIVVKKIKFMRCSKRHGGVVVPNFVRFLRIHSAFISREQLAICPWLLYIPQGCHPSLNGKDSP